MNEDRNQDAFPKQQTLETHPDEWQRDLNPNRLAGRNIEPGADVRGESDRTAFHLRKSGMRLRGDDDELKQVPVLAEGERLQQGATYVDLTQQPPREFTARGRHVCGWRARDVPRDRVPDQLWNRSR